MPHGVGAYVQHTVLAVKLCGYFSQLLEITTFHVWKRFFPSLERLIGAYFYMINCRAYPSQKFFRIATNTWKPQIIYNCRFLKYGYSRAQSTAIRTISRGTVGLRSSTGAYCSKSDSLFQSIQTDITTGAGSISKVGVQFAAVGAGNFFYCAPNFCSRCPPCPAIRESGGHVPPVPHGVGAYASD